MGLASLTDGGRFVLDICGCDTGEGVLCNGVGCASTSLLVAMSSRRTLKLVEITLGVNERQHFITNSESW